MRLVLVLLCSCVVAIGCDKKKKKDPVARVDQKIDQITGGDGQNPDGTLAAPVAPVAPVRTVAKRACQADDVIVVFAAMSDLNSKTQQLEGIVDRFGYMPSRSDVNAAIAKIDEMEVVCRRTIDPVDVANCTDTQAKRAWDSIQSTCTRKDVTKGKLESIRARL